MKRTFFAHRALALSALAFALGSGLSPSIAAAAEPTKTGAAAADSPASSELSAELMYKLLIGDIALQREEPALAARAFCEPARGARAPARAGRPTGGALSARQRTLALE